MKKWESAIVVNTMVMFGNAVRNGWFQKEIRYFHAGVWEIKLEMQKHDGCACELHVSRRPWECYKDDFREIVNLPVRYGNLEDVIRLVCKAVKMT